MLLKLPPSLHYPITVTELLKRPNDNVERFAPLFSYSYKTTVTEGDGLGNDYQVLKTFPTRFESNVEGTLTQWKIEEGAVIARPDVAVAEIEEPCTHSVQFGGMCVDCGKDMTESSYNTDQLDSNRATINMVHNNVSLTVSQDEAARADNEAKKRLLELKKLSLVVDLDQTIIHATVDPTVGDWQKDEDNPNHGAVKDVRAFLLDDDVPGKPGCWYYIKLRPGLEEFLDNVSKIYELHIYTMGTRAYAKNIAKIIDPHERIFGDRILSRTESGSMTAKNLQRLFPVDTKMVVIIDDRADVWKWSPNLIKVTPYDFFVGIGDINSSFLPKIPGPRPAPKTAPDPPLKPNGDAPEVSRPEGSESKMNGHLDHQNDASSTEEPLTPIISNGSPLEQLVAMGGSDDVSMREAQTSSQKETVDKQVEERPLLQKQKQLEAQDAATESAATTTTEVGDTRSSSEDSSQPKHNLLQDHDRELFQLERSLRSVHTEFFNTYQSQLAASTGSRLNELRTTQKRKAPTDTSVLDLVPDIKSVLPSVKARVLGGLVLVFSSVVPLGIDMATTDIGILAQSFGARIEEKVNRHTTHVVAVKDRTNKVTDARKRRIHVVTPQWLLDSIANWTRKSEGEYLLEPSEHGRSSHVEDDDILSESESPVEEDETDNDNASRETPKPLNLKIDTHPPSSEAGDTEPDIDFAAIEDGSPVGGTHDDWADMNKEAEDFFGDMGSDDEGYDPFDNDDDDDDEEGDRRSLVSDSSAATSKISVRGKKRDRDESDSEGESTRKKPTLSTGLTSLSQTTNVDEEEEELGGEDATATATPTDEAGSKQVEAEEEEEEDDGWGDELGKEFEEEMRRAASEEDQEGEG